MKTTDIRSYPDNYGDLSMNAALRAERIACQMRNLVYLTSPKRRNEYLKDAATAQGIEIHQDREVLSIALPSLLPRRKHHVNTAFLHEPLNYALQEYLTTHTLPLYQECVVCFSQIYDRNGPFNRIRDYDNLEFKQILDTIVTYVMVDDTGLYCDSYYTTELGKKDYTVIYIMTKSRFLSWLEERKNDIETISEIS